MKNKIHHYDLLEEMIRERDQRLILQAKEYERRLESLNHENERIMEILKQSVPREVYDRGLESINSKIGIAIETLNSKIQINTDYINAAKGKGTGANAVIGYIFGAAGFLAALVAVFYYLSKK